MLRSDVYSIRTWGGSSRSAARCSSYVHHKLYVIKIRNAAPDPTVARCPPSQHWLLLLLLILRDKIGFDRVAQSFSAVLVSGAPA
jgi:hypothetical protein